MTTQDTSWIDEYRVQATALSRARSTVRGLEMRLAAKVDERARRESEMRNTLQNIRDLNLRVSRQLLIRQVESWLELDADCEVLARQVVAAEERVPA